MGGTWIYQRLVHEARIVAQSRWQTLSFPGGHSGYPAPPHTHIRERYRSTCSDFGPVQPVTRQNCPVHSFAQVSALNPSVQQSTDVWATFWVLQVSATPATFQSPDQT